MKTASVTEAKVQFSKLLERVMAGEKIGITIRGREVARLIPVTLQGHGHAGDSRGSLWFQTISMIPLLKWLNRTTFEGKPPKRPRRVSGTNGRERLEVGWETGIEPATFGATDRRSTS